MSRPPFNRLPVVTELFGGKGIPRLREGRSLVGWLPLLLAPVLGVLVALLIARGSWHLLMPIFLLVPMLILVGRYPLAAILLWILVFPFFVETPGTLERNAYYLLHRAMIPGTLAYVIVSQGLGVRRRTEPVRLGPAELAMVIFLVLAVANIVLSGSNPEQNLFHLYDHLFVPFCAYLLVRLTSPTEKDLKYFLWVAFITVVIQAAIGLLSWFLPQVLPSQWLGRQGERTTGTFGNPAVYSTTLIFLALLLFQRAMHCRSGRLRAVLLSAAMLAFFGVVFTFSRGSWLAGAVVLLGLVFLYPKVTIRLTVIVAVLSVILGIGLLAREASWARQRLNADETAQGRIILLNTGLGMVQAKPLFGWGYGTYDRYDNQFKTRVGDIPVRADNTSHNTYLTIMAELGIIAFLFYAYPMVHWLVLSIRVRRRLPRHGFWSWRLLSMYWLAVIAHIVASSFMDMFRFNEFGTTMWWLTLGLIASMVYPLQKSGELATQHGGLSQ